MEEATAPYASVLRWAIAQTAPAAASDTAASAAAEAAPAAAPILLTDGDASTPAGGGGAVLSAPIAVPASEAARATRPMRESDQRWLEEAIQSAFVDEAKVLKSLCASLVTAEEPAEQLRLLNSINEFCENLDNADILHAVGGFEPMLRLLDSGDAQVAAAAAEGVSSVVQNHPRTQALALSFGALPRLVRLLARFLHVLDARGPGTGDGAGGGAGGGGGGAGGGGGGAEAVDGAAASTSMDAVEHAEQALTKGVMAISSLVRANVPGLEELLAYDGSDQVPELSAALARMPSSPSASSSSSSSPSPTVPVTSAVSSTADSGGAEESKATEDEAAAGDAGPTFVPFAGLGLALLLRVLEVGPRRARNKATFMLRHLTAGPCAARLLAAARRLKNRALAGADAAPGTSSASAGSPSSSLLDALVAAAEEGRGGRDSSLVEHALETSAQILHLVAEATLRLPTEAALRRPEDVADVVAFAHDTEGLARLSATAAAIAAEVAALPTREAQEARREEAEACVKVARLVTLAQRVGARLPRA